MASGLASHPLALSSLPAGNDPVACCLHAPCGARWQGGGMLLAEVAAASADVAATSSRLAKIARLADGARARRAGRGRYGGVVAVR